MCASCSAGGSLVDQGYGFTVFFGNWYCPCVFESDYDYKRRGLGKRGGGGGSFKSSGGGKTSGSNAAAGATGETKMAEKAAEIAVKKGLDAVMMYGSSFFPFREVPSCLSHIAHFRISQQETDDW